MDLDDYCEEGVFIENDDDDDEVCEQWKSEGWVK